jgi:hypothetical protein
VNDVERFDWKPERDLAVDLLEKVGIPVGPFVRYAEAVYERRARRVGDVLSEGARLSGRAVEDVLALSERDALGDLLTEVVNAASGARSDAHVRALARVLAVAVAGGDDAQVDDLHEVVHVISRLSPLDVRALHALEKTGPQTGDAAIAGQLARPFDVIRAELNSMVLASPIEKKLGDLALINPGIAYDESRVHIVTPFGRRVLAYLTEVDTGDQTTTTETVS